MGSYPRAYVNPGSCPPNLCFKTETKLIYQRFYLFVSETRLFWVVFRASFFTALAIAAWANHIIRSLFVISFFTWFWTGNTMFHYFIYSYCWNEPASPFDCSGSALAKCVGSASKHLVIDFLNKFHSRIDFEGSCCLINKRSKVWTSSESHAVRDNSLQLL